MPNRVIALLIITMSLISSGLVHSLEIADKDKNNAQAYIDYAISKQRSEPDKANEALEVAYQLAKKQQDLYLLTRSLLQFAQTAKLQKKYSVAEEYLLNAEGRISVVNDDELSVNVLTNMSTVQRYLTNYAESMKYVKKAKKIADKSRDSRLIFKSIMTEAKLLEKMKRYDDSITEYLSAQRYILGGSFSDRYRLLRGTANAYIKVNEHESAVRYYSKAVKLIEENNNHKNLSDTLNQLAKTQAKLGQFSLAIENSKRALSVAHEYKKEKDILKSYVVLSILYRKISSYEESLDVGLKAVALYQKRKDLNGVAASANSIGLVYTHLNQLENAKNYFQQVLDLPSDKIQAKYRAAALRDLGILVFTDDPIKGLELSNESYAIYEKIFNRNGVATVQKNLGYIYHEMGRIDYAIDSYSSAITLFQSMNDVWNEAETKARLALVFIDSELKKSVVLAKSSLELAQSIGAKSLAEQAYGAFILIEEKKENYKQALAYAKIKEALVNEIKTDAINKRSAEMNIILNVEKKEREFERLKREKAVISLELDNQANRLSLLEKEKEITDLQAQNTMIIVSVIILTVILGLLVIARIYFNLKYKYVAIIVFMIIGIFYSFSAYSTDIIKIPGRSSSLDVRPKYTHLVLHKALELSEDKYGPYKVSIVDGFISNDVKRWAIFEGEELNLTMAMTSPDWEYLTTPIRIPIRRGVGSYRLLAINKDNQETFKNITTVKELKKLSVGLQSGWIINGILGEEGFKVIESTTYDGIFKMLNGERFDYIPRGIHEIYDEIFLRERELQNLMVEPNLALYIPQPYYIFVSPKHPRIAERVAYGLEKMVAEGILQNMFDEHYARFIIRADLANRTIIKLGNKHLTTKTPIERNELWLNFEHYKSKVK